MTGGTSSLDVPKTELERKSSLRDKFRGLSRSKKGEKGSNSLKDSNSPQQTLEDPKTGFVISPQESRGRSVTRLDYESEYFDSNTGSKRNSIAIPESSMDDVVLASAATDSTIDDLPVLAPAISSRVEETFPKSSESSDHTEEVPQEGYLLQPSGFLSSVFSAATNFGTALTMGASKQVRPPVLSLINDNPDGSTSSTPRKDILNSVKTAGHSRTGHELSLKDMGIIGPDEYASSSPVPPSRTEPDSSKNDISEAKDAFDDKKVLNARSGSVSTTRNRKRRGSTATSIFGSAETQSQKITGFAVASNKRNREFHATFRSVPDADYLLDDYGCALQKEILVHGRMYVSESHICFNSNIFGWVTNLVISFNDITSIEKKSTAGIFPNAIQITAGQAKHVFASFISRDTTYELIVNIWRLTHPLIQTTAHGVEIAGAEGSSSNSTDSEDSGEESADSESFDEGFFEREVEADNGDGSSRAHDSPQLEPISSTAGTDAESMKAKNFPGPIEHLPTEAPSLSDGTSYAKALLDEIFEAPVGKLFDLLFGDDTSFMKDFLTNNQKVLEVQVGKFNDKEGQNSRTITYVKPLNGPIGPKQTRCICEDLIELKDFGSAVQVVQSTTSPDVPNGDLFVIKTRFSLMWAARNNTRLVSNCTIEWSKSSWIKGPIEKGANSGQVQFMSDLAEAIRAHLLGSGGKKKSGKIRKQSLTQKETVVKEAPTTTVQTEDGRGLLGLISSVSEHVHLNVLIFVILFGLTISVMRIQHALMQDPGPRSGSGVVGIPEYHWQQEEADLWSWLSSRTFSGEDAHGSSEIRSTNLADDSLSKLQIQEALLQARARLSVLEEAEERMNTPNK